MLGQRLLPSAANYGTRPIPAGRLCEFGAPNRTFESDGDNICSSCHKADEIIDAIGGIA
jgi:hypothetical protein